jgi:hypothetical protein
MNTVVLPNWDQLSRDPEGMADVFTSIVSGLLAIFIR